MSNEMATGAVDGMTSTIEKPVEKNERTIRSFSNLYNQGTKHKQLIIEECNSAENWTPIVEAFKAGRARDISDEPKVDKVPCVVIGSGPSLDCSIKHLKQWKGGILCSTSHALTLMYHGIEPTHIVCLDPFSGWDEIKGVDWSKTRTKLVTHPGITPEMVAMWPNEMLLYIQDNGHPDSFYETTQKRQYTWRDGPPRNPTFHFYIRTKMTIFACSPPMQMFVADRLGYGTVFLCGVDFGFPHGKERFTGYTVGDDGKWITHEHPYSPSDGAVMTNSGVLTAEMHLYYKKNMISAWRLSHQQMYSTDQGIMPEVPYTNVEKMIQKQGLNYPTQSHEMIERITERYLASVGAFVIVTYNGVAFIESDKPLEDLPAFMAGIHQQYKCDKCSAQSVGNDARDHTGEQCPGCKEGKILHSVGINVEANMERVQKLLAFVKAREILAEKDIKGKQQDDIMEGVGRELKI